MYLRFKNGTEKAVTLSYDDGMIFDRQLIEILDKYGLKGTFNINTGQYYPENGEESNYRRLKLSEAIELYRHSGHEVAAHTVNHPSLELLDDTEILYEITEDRKNIERDFNVVAKGMAYPVGTYSDRVVRLLKNCGISYARTIESTEKFSMPMNWYTWNPTCHHNNPKLMELAKRFMEEKTWGRPKLFYLWGHSFEFHRDNNWSVIESFAEYMGGQNNIWYATNIEIYNYVKAYERLETSFDKSIIYNPTVLDVWVAFDDKVIKIEAGKTIYRKG